MCKTGSTTEILNPNRKHINTIFQMLFVSSIVEPNMSPIGIMAMSTPIRNISSPKIIKTAPIRNLIKDVLSMGTIVKFRINTIMVMGITENKASLNFFSSTFNSVHILWLFFSMDYGKSYEI